MQRSLRRFTSVVTTLAVVCQPALSASQFAGEPRPAEQADRRVQEATGAGSTAVSTVLARADVALARSLVAPNIARGDMAEAVVNTVLISDLRRSGGWVPIRARFGSQGLDHVMMKFDASGRPRDLMVAETKYNRGRLGQTRDGIQMGERWQSPRLIALGNRYEQFHDLLANGEMRIGSPAGRIPVNQSLEIPLPNGHTATVWREDGRSPWNIDADPGDLVQAQRQFSRIAEHLKAAGEGRITYRCRVFTVEPVGRQLHVTVRDAKLVGNGARSLADLPKVSEFTIPLEGKTLRSVRQITEEQVAGALRRSLPHMSAAEVDELAGQTVRVMNSLEETAAAFGRSVFTPIAIHSLASGGVVALLDASITVAADLVAGRDIDVRRVATGTFIAFASGTAGAALGQSTVIIITRNALLHHFAQTTAAALGLPGSSLVANAAGATVAGGAFSLAYSLLGYELGLMDSRTARRTAIAGAAGSVAGAAVTTATLGLVVAYGSASTGVAISGLSGAAATSASLAFLGGGSIAAGGGGVALGSTILTGGAVLVVVAVGAGVMYTFHYLDEKKETTRLQLTIEYLQKEKDLSGKGIQ